MGRGWGGEVGGGNEGGGEDVVEEFGGGGRDLDGVVEDGEEAEEFVGLSPLGGTDVVEGAGLLALAILHAVAEPGTDDLQAGDFELPHFGTDGTEHPGTDG